MAMMSATADGQTNPWRTKGRPLCSMASWSSATCCARDAGAHSNPRVSNVGLSPACGGKHRKLTVRQTCTVTRRVGASWVDDEHGMSLTRYACTVLEPNLSPACPRSVTPEQSTHSRHLPYAAAVFSCRLRTSVLLTAVRQARGVMARSAVTGRQCVDLPSFSHMLD